VSHYYVVIFLLQIVPAVLLLANRMFSPARLCIFAAWVDTIYCAPRFLLCVIAASISVIASRALPMRRKSFGPQCRHRSTSLHLPGRGFSPGE